MNIVVCGMYFFTENINKYFLGIKHWLSMFIGVLFFDKNNFRLIIETFF